MLPSLQGMQCPFRDIFITIHDRKNLDCQGKPNSVGNSTITRTMFFHCWWLKSFEPIRSLTNKARINQSNWRLQPFVASSWSLLGLWQARQNQKSNWHQLSVASFMRTGVLTVQFLLHMYEWKKPLEHHNKISLWYKWKNARKYKLCIYVGLISSATKNITWKLLGCSKRDIPW